jgi:hypothetical protein
MNGHLINVASFVLIRGPCVSCSGKRHHETTKRIQNHTKQITMYNRSILRICLVVRHTIEALRAGQSCPEISTVIFRFAKGTQLGDEGQARAI